MPNRFPCRSRLRILSTDSKSRAVLQVFKIIIDSVSERAKVPDNACKYFLSAWNVKLFTVKFMCSKISPNLGSASQIWTLYSRITITRINARYYSPIPVGWLLLAMHIKNQTNMIWVRGQNYFTLLCIISYGDTMQKTKGFWSQMRVLG